MKSIEELGWPLFLPPLLQTAASAASGILLTLAFPDTGFGFLAFIALVPFLASISQLNYRRAFSSGMVMGLFHYITLLYWMVPTMGDFGGLPIAASVSTLILFCLYLSLYPALFALTWKYLAKGPLIQIISGPCLWVLLEVLRTHLFTGFPWGALGYSQYQSIHIVQMADLFGVTGISFFIVWVNIFLFQLLQTIASKKRVKKSALLKIQSVAAAAITLILAPAIWQYGNHRMAAIENTIQKSPGIRVSLIQGNIGQEEKHLNLQTSIDTYGNLSLAATGQHPDVIIWPETAMPFFYKRQPLHAKALEDYIKKAKTPFIIGTLGLESPSDKSPQKTNIRNRAMLIDSSGKPIAHHDKYHLVPFGEYVPLEPILGKLGKLIAQAGNFSPGKGECLPLKSTLLHQKINSCSFGMLICFESLFPSLTRKLVLNHADILVIITNDAWFGRTSAPTQHFSLAVLRAVESRRSVARAANTGISGFIDPTGRILDQTAIYEQAVSTKKIPILTELTFYTRHPFCLPIAASLALLAILVLHIRAKNKPIT